MFPTGRARLPNMSKRDDASHWISMSDLMTGLMLIFLLIAILTISQIVKKEENKKELLQDYEAVKEQIHEDLQEAFADREEEWGIEISPDLIIKFSNPDVLFDRLSDDITPRFETILSEFVPQYLAIVNKTEYTDRIKEVRIEGHTAAWDDYLFTIRLSQSRANSVLAYILASEAYTTLIQEDQDKLRFWLTANGLGNGQAIDESGEYVFFSKNPISADSRRVEFQIVTTTEELLEEIMRISL